MEINKATITHMFANKQKNCKCSASEFAIETLKNSKENYDNIDCIIFSTGTMDNIGSSTGALIKSSLKISECSVYDISAGGVPLATALKIANDFIVTNSYKNILVVACDVISRFNVPKYLYSDKCYIVRVKNSTKGNYKVEFKDYLEHSNDLKILIGGSKYSVTEEGLKYGYLDPYYDNNKIIGNSITSILPSYKSYYFSEEMLNINWKESDLLFIQDDINALRSKISLEDSFVIFENKAGNTVAQISIN